jgi:acyl-CoA thioester hydrolase
MHKHSETFRIRHDECDAYGVLNNAIYLRLAQEAAWQHSIQAGFGPEYYESKQRAWIARDTTIEYQAPVRYGEQLRITTYVTSTRRTLARRMYEFETDRSIAQAHTDWVFLDLPHGTPATIPDEIVEGLFSADSQPVRLKRSPFPEPPPPPSGTVTWRGRVQWRDIDPFGHLNNAAYISYMEAAATEAGLAYGISQESSGEAGVGWALKRSRIEYLEPARVEDQLEISTWLSSLRKASAERHYQIKRAADGHLLARGLSLWLTTDVITGRPRRLPTWMAEALSPNLAK